VPVEHVRKHATQIVICKRVVRHGDQRFRRDPAAPEVFPKPVADLGGPSGHVVLYRVAYTTNCLARYVNRKIRFGLETNHRIEPVARVALGVRMRKTIAQVERDFTIVRVTHDRLAIAPFPTTQCAGFEVESHAIRGKTAAPRGRMKPSPPRAWSNAAASVGAGIIRIRFTSSGGSSDTSTTR